AVLLALIIAVGYYYVGFIATLDSKVVQNTADDGHNHDHSEQQSVAQQQQLPVPSAQEVQQVRDQLEADPTNADLQLQLGNMLFDSQRYREAILYYSKVLDFDPNNADVRVDLGVSHFNLQEFKVAEEQFKLALKGQPDHLNALYNMGIVSLKLGEVNQLISYWGQLIEKAPDSGQAQQAKAYLEELHQEIEQFPKVNEQTES
ncbi:MAG: tetratricopeptide repeat protein, partial [Calditrichota bacterium]